MPIMNFSAKAHSENPTRTVVQTRSFTIIIDEPAGLGGTDTGANPVEYVLAALSGCLSVVGHAVAGEMGFTLRGITFSLDGDLDPAKFMGQTTTGRAGYTVIRVKLAPDADADAATLTQWLAAVESRCPVSDNLANATPVQLSLG